MGRPRKHEVIDPECNQRDSAAHRQNRTNQTDGVVTQVVENSGQIANGSFGTHMLPFPSFCRRALTSGPAAIVAITADTRTPPPKSASATFILRETSSRPQTSHVMSGGDHPWLRQLHGPPF